jgi:predicted ATPase
MQSSKCKSKQSNAQVNAKHKQCKQANAQANAKHKQMQASNQIQAWASKYKQANRQKQANDESNYVYEMQARKYKPVSKTAS